MWGEKHCFCLCSLYQHITLHLPVLRYAPAPSTQRGRTCANVAAGCADRVHLPVQCVPQEQGKMVNNSKWGRLKAMVPIKPASPAAPLLVSWVLVRKKAIKWPRLWGKSYFSGLDVSVLSFLVITVWNSLLAEPPSSTFFLLRDTVAIGYSATESPGRSITSLLPTAVGSLAPRNGGRRTIC